MPADFRMANFIFDILKIGKYEVNKGSIVEFNFTEGIDHPAIVGELVIRDFEGWMEEREIFAGDKIELSFSTEESEGIHFIGQIYASENNNRVAMEQGATTSFKFCSPWFFNAMTRQISKSWRDKYPHEIIQDLIEECGGTVQYRTNPTGSGDGEKFERFVSPYWTAAHTIKYLTDFITTTGTNHGAFLFFPDITTDEVIITTLNDLFNNELKEHPAEFIFDSGNVEYEGSIKDYNIETLYDAARYTNMGAFNSKIVGFDFDRNMVIETAIPLSSYSANHLSAYAPMLQSYTGDDYRSTKFSHYHPQTRLQTKTNEKLKRMLEGSLKTKYSLLFGDLIKIGFVTNGSSTRHVGQIVKVNFPSVEYRGEGTMNKQLEGYYIVRNIRHGVYPNTYAQALTLVTDGYFSVKRQDLVSW